MYHNKISSICIKINKIRLLRQSKLKWGIKKHLMVTFRQSDSGPHMCVLPLVWHPCVPSAGISLFFTMSHRIRNFGGKK